MNGRRRALGLIRRPAVFTALFFATCAAVLLVPLLWGSTWMLDNGRTVLFVVGLGFSMWWFAMEPPGVRQVVPKRQKGDPPYEPRHRKSR